MKRCGVCNEVKPLDAFSKRGDGRAGVRSACKACRTLESARRYREDPEAWRARLQSWRGRNPEAYGRHKIESAAKQREYEATPEGREAKRERERRYHRENPEIRQAIYRRQYERHKDRFIQRAVDYRGRKADAFVESVHPLILLERNDGVCGICGGDVDPFDFHIDHIVPLSRGGLHNYENTQPACPACNWSKGARLPEELAA